MLSSKAFIELVDDCLHRKLNKEQKTCVSANTATPLLIIAGPGTGKTTVMVLRALRHLLVDGFPPESIVITTFTKKAAQEVRTRWLNWGLPLIERAKQHPSMQSEAAQRYLDRVDLNHCVTGTLDSICQDLIGEYREAGTITPVLIEGYPANQLLLRSGLQDQFYANQAAMKSYLAQFTFSQDEPSTLADLLGTSRPIIDRFVHDRVDIKKYRAGKMHADARQIMADAQSSYLDVLTDGAQLDFALLEQDFLNKVSSGKLDEAVRPWKALLVDEYQDTNPLQEAIYFEIVRRSGVALSVVGDDDQSLYRFRGATVELFTNFVPRLAKATQQEANTAYLTLNYRSTPEITTFFNAFLNADPAFASARIQPPKPPIKPDRPSDGVPILGMFRKDMETLAADLTTFLFDVFRGGGRRIALPGGGHTNLAGARKGGDFGDAVILSYTVNEFKRFWGETTPRLPSLLRNAFAERGVGVFNPRGQALHDQVDVQILLGLLLECLDRSDAQNPDGRITPDVKGLTNVARSSFQTWRQCAQAFMAKNPAPGGLRGFVDAWAVRTSQVPRQPWPDEWPVLELCFKLISWMPEFREDPEHQIWLEAISRSAAQSRLFSPYGGSIRNRKPHDERSRGSIIRDILRPIAEGLVDVDEDLITHVPRDRLNFMTIHQAKGLEFPLVVVDVSSNFSTNHAKTAAFRFPARPSNVTALEDDLAPFTEAGKARLKRNALDRTFDDLMRLYYVAYSRPQSALLLVGLEKSIVTGSTVKTVSTGWRRDEVWTWHDPKQGKTTVANQLPLVRI